MKNVLAIILGGGKGNRLYPLTKLRSKPAVPLNGKYRLIDIPISNCLNSDISRIFVLTQFNSASLNRHVNTTYRFDSFRKEGFVTILAAEQTQQSTDWFQGTADAVRKTLRHYSRFSFEHYLILSGDHIYRMDYRLLMADHINKGSDVTVTAIPVLREKAPELGILDINGNGDVISFVEKPGDRSVIDTLEIKPQTWKNFGKDIKPGYCLANMGVYVFRREVLEKILDKWDYTDFGKEIFPETVKSPELKVSCYMFEGYWEDVGTIRSFFEANLGFVEPLPLYSFYDENAPIYTRPRFLPPSKITRTTAERAILSEGCVVDDAGISRSIIGVRSLVGRGSRIINTIMMGADRYETQKEKDSNRTMGIPDIGIGHDCHIEGCIIDKDARIGRGVTIISADMPDAQGNGWMLRDGVVVIEKQAIIPDGTSIVFKQL
ncbi:MAG: glucose-1-phosphate adenylyltransferase [Deltaproteobacteria bacterium]|nr:glucose-1-phosphate adenylyltransferase [Deltaproteobacteria bacterium]